MSAYILATSEFFGLRETMPRQFCIKSFLSRFLFIVDMPYQIIIIYIMLHIITVVFVLITQLVRLLPFVVESLCFTMLPLSWLS